MLGFEPAYTTAEAFADFGAALTPTGGRRARGRDAASSRPLAAAAARPGPCEEADRG